jgi:hypothetical protein
MAEIKTVLEAKLLLGQEVHFRIENIPHENLKSLDVLSGVVTRIESRWTHTIQDEACDYWTANIDVTDKNDGGLYHLSTSKIFTDDTKDIDIVNVSIDEEINKLAERIVVLEGSKAKILVDNMKE